MNYFNNRKRPVAEHVYAELMVWQCSDCICWSRQEFISGAKPLCPMCTGTMRQEAKIVRIE